MRRVLFIILLLFPVIVFGQKKHGQSLIDSLLPELPKLKNDTNKVNCLELISYTYSSINPTDGVKYGQQALELAKELKWQKGIAVAYADIAINREGLSEHAGALDYDLKALEIYHELADSSGVAAVLSNMGLIYHRQGNYNKALEQFIRALAINESLGNKKTQAKILDNIGTLYFEQKNYAKTRQYYLQALSIYEKIDSKAGMARCLGNMGMVFNAEGKNEIALEYHFKALKANRELGHNSSVQVNLANIGLVYSQLKKYDKALEYQLQALKLSKSLKSETSIAVDLGNIGETYFAMGTDPAMKMSKSEKAQNLKLSIKYLDEAITICKKIDFLGPLAEFSQYISDAHFLSANYKEAFETYKQHITIKDSVFSQENKLLLAKQEADYQLSLKNKDIIIKDKQLEIARLQKENKSKESIILIGGIVLLLIVALIFGAKYTNRIRKQKRALREIAQIQSHDVRGPVSKLLGLVQLFNQENPADPVNKEVIQYIDSTAAEIDTIVNAVVDKTYFGKRKNTK